jgi:hypothetical protein
MGAQHGGQRAHGFQNKKASSIFSTNACGPLRQEKKSTAAFASRA